jgi:hypothetical protein
MAVEGPEIEATARGRHGGPNGGGRALATGRNRGARKQLCKLGKNPLYSNFGNEIIES